VSLFLTCLAIARLPDTEAVQNAYLEASATLEGEDPEVAAKAYFLIFLATDPTAENAGKMADATFRALRDDFQGYEISREMEGGIHFHLSRLMASQFPDDEAMEETYLVIAAQTGLLPWADLQAKLIARGDLFAMELGLQRLEKNPEPLATLAPFTATLAEVMTKVELWDRGINGLSLGWAGICPAIDHKD
tara:strand:- start:284 stop:856 length:573 start_codon:yes stop_codon:yes gene_type:complete